MVPVYSPITESETATIASMLEAYEIPFYIRGVAFSRLYPGMQIKDHNTPTFMVLPKDYEATRDLLSVFIKPEVTSKEKRSYLRTIRVTFEIFFFGWAFPSERWNKNRK